jgi:dihydrofolate reductase
VSARIALIAAVAENGVIGRDGKLPWRIADDMKWFKETTMGKPCIMGRKTWESFPKRPLPGRTNIVVTRDPAFEAQGGVVALSLDEALGVAAREAAAEVMIIGGADIYRAALPRASRVYLTSVHGAFEGDTHFPGLDAGDWIKTVLATNSASPERAIGYSFIVLDRKVLPHARL